MKIASIDVVSDNTGEVIEDMKERVAIGLKAIGQEIEGYAIDDCPVDTSTLKNSITHEMRKNGSEVAVGTAVKYAPYVEYIDRYHHNVGKAHFLRDAVTNHMDHYKAIMEAALDS